MMCFEQVLEKEKGNFHYKNKEFKMALDCYSKAIELDPIDITFRTNKAGKLLIVLI